MKNIVLRGLTICLLVSMTSLFNFARAHVDSNQITQADTTIQEKDKKEKKEKKRKDEFIVYAGVNFNQLSVSSSQFESQLNLGYHLGGAYKRGKFFYWQIGARYNNAGYRLNDVNTGEDSTFFNFGVRGIDIPVTGGINFLSFVNRLVALRLFVSAVPSFALGVGDNDLGITKDDINSFILYGQGGIGINVAFIVFEVGYNYGFQDLLKDDIESKPGQIFISLGFRF